MRPHRATRGDHRHVTLPIVWQRLVSGGETCPWCGSTQESIEHAVATLTEVYARLNIEPTLETIALDQATFDEAPTESNRIWIAGRPLEDWVGAEVSASQCCSVCGTNDCRTLQIDGASYEAVPETLIVKAGLAAASTLVRPDRCCRRIGAGAECPTWCLAGTRTFDDAVLVVGQVATDSIRQHRPPQPWRSRTPER